MGMRLGLLTLGETSIARILEDPALVWRVISPDESANETPNESTTTTKQAKKPASRAKKGTSKPKATSTAAPTFKLGEGEGNRCDLDKAWHGIHYLLTGTAWEGEGPLDFLVSGGQQVGEIDPSHGPVRVFGPAEVQAINNGLNGVSTYELRKRFNARDMVAKDIYPEIWARSPMEYDSLGFLIDHVEKLRAFLRGATEANLGMIVFFTD